MQRNQRLLKNLKMVKEQNVGMKIQEDVDQKVNVMISIQRKSVSLLVSLDLARWNHPVSTGTLLASVLTGRSTGPAMKATCAATATHTTWSSVSSVHRSLF